LLIVKSQQPQIGHFTLFDAFTYMTNLTF